MSTSRYLETPFFALKAGLERIGNVIRTRRCADGGGGFLVAQVNPTLSDCREITALFAAAPDLLEALQTLVLALPEDGEWAHFLDIKQAARAAIKKARELST